MSRQDPLSAELLAAAREKKTGRLLVYCAGSENDLWPRPAEADLRDGEMIALKFAELAGIAALGELASRTIERAAFIAAGSLSDQNRDATLPPMKKILALLGVAAEERAAAAEPEDDTEQLISEVRLAITQIYGPQATAKLDEVATLSPPEKVPIAYLRRCRTEIIRGLSGVKTGSAVAQRYQPLIEKLS